MNRNGWLAAAALCGAALLNPQELGANATVGEPAPAFAGTDANGKPVSLADYKGKLVVLEWVNPGCPFVKKHYDSGNMPAAQSKAMARDVAWVSIQTSGDSEAADSLKSWQQEMKATPSSTLVDADGSIGRAYGARTTPHMYIVDGEGTLVYAGAIDSNASSDPADIAGATNYVTQALDELLADKVVSKPVTQPYGCSVKYPG